MRQQQQILQKEKKDNKKKKEKKKNIQMRIFDTFNADNQQYHFYFAIQLVSAPIKEEKVMCNFYN